MSIFDFFNKKNKNESNPFSSTIPAKTGLRGIVFDKIKFTATTKSGVESFQSDIVKLHGKSDTLMIIVGMNGSVYGYKNKYLQIAKKANTSYGSSVFIFANDLRNWHDPAVYFDTMMRYIKKNAPGENGVKLFGFSAGASLASYYAYKYPEITNMLLINPPLANNLEPTINGMRGFSGYSALVVGKKDPDYKLGELFTLNSYRGVFDDVILFENADHHFKGLLNEFIDLPSKYLYNKSPYGHFSIYI